ncbi:uncharacterized protein A1O9_01041 [Exophiala aquamarina CBS 119918]|uniref:Uncharacterized protein n=1 Tax=Exophiala aquamarina CBS 119918 TaxID=1182545 RepID=A0A072Q560_9EURO|nr:uncharacterized protein A1O9_01041 [Exophiala aquamarina CBS 119918]KEF63065.1 hypothetical protein A1O9_01041 [Exophiala aquamarina CBS 119918]
MGSYVNSGAVNTDVDVDTSRVKGQTALVTGGANGIGEAYTRALAKAGAFVVIADLDDEFGSNLEKELSGSVKFVKTNVTSWADQLAAFKTALSSSPCGRIDIVIANAGISGADTVFQNELELDEPEEPRLNILNVNLTGVLYTIKLALFYFRKQHAANKGEALDQNLILQGSLAGYLDLPGALQYTASKFGLRGLMRDLRRTEHAHNIRVNFIGPWFIRTKIMSDTVLQYLDNLGVDFATVEDAAAAALRIIADPKVVGRSFAIVPRSLAPRGYQDIDFDDYEEGSFLGKLQALAAGGTHRTQVSIRTVPRTCDQ